MLPEDYISLFPRGLVLHTATSYGIVFSRGLVLHPAMLGPDFGGQLGGAQGTPKTLLRVPRVAQNNFGPHANARKNVFGVPWAPAS